MASGRIVSVRRIRPKTVAPAKPKKKKKPTRKKGAKSFVFPTIDIPSQRKDIDISTGARQPATILLTGKRRVRPEE